MIIISDERIEALARKIARKLKVKYSKLQVEKFPDKEFKVNIKDAVKRKKVVFVWSFGKKPNYSLVKCLLAAYTARNLGAKKIILVASFLPYLRQDKRFKRGESISAKIIPMILSNVFDKVYVVDPHLHRFKNLDQIFPRNKAVKLSANSEIANYIKTNFNLKNILIIGPDKESFQWAKDVAKRLNLKAVVLKKVRYSPKKVKVKFDHFNLKGKDIIVIDDIISTGKTMIETLKLAKQHKANKLTAIGVHGILVENADKKIRKYANLITTNTILNKYSKIDVSNVIVNKLKNV